MVSKISLFLAFLGFLFGYVVLGPAERVCSAENKKPAIKEIQVYAEEVTLFVRIAGNPSSKNVLIGINGGPGQSSKYMSNLDRLVGVELSVVTYDQRGTGQSSDPSNGYGLTAYVEDLEAIRQAVGAKKIHILGHSWGGIIAMCYATVYPQNVHSIILMGSGPPKGKIAQAGQAQLNKRILSLQKQGVIPKARPRNMKNLIELILPAYFSDPKFPIPTELKNTDFSTVAYQQTMTALGDWDLSIDVAELRHPVLLLWGEDDPFGLPVFEATKNALSNAELEFVVLKECGHYWHECENIFFHQVRDFLKLAHELPGQ